MLRERPGMVEIRRASALAAASPTRSASTRPRVRAVRGAAGVAPRETPRRGKALAEPVAGASFAAATRGHFAAVLRHAWILLSKRVPAGGRSTKTFAVA
ncbi:hypothetical protein A8H35_11965 [Burkholderia thailandensis]|uniref:Uncharacterized protein n=1 Tax=Burkholderia thailandensis (strain ATCC 700388 / DSM 13276 / CCUG 48851 / CIP 106301 / E264) TaxID=271848 RepID=Q2SXY6_BURTA|nr:hypothetical protein [Burkholderia thailandensis]ABC39166.1 hypothetical protein BTH_I1676 [Burkholderia thailandensis E264]AVR11394.1 hypothetical protein A8H31_30505 [Burkholderia thailandensis]AWY59022.1 hypothetical protein A8H35_11965 [Burkholderia thailandensis]AWY66804.1 hypothetical protein A8H36_16475 [Burkholderia thailandensis]NOK40245.1 hypothetical protein [Burkholderia thailandensis]